MPYRTAQSFQGKVFLARIYEKSRALCRFSRAITCSLPLVMEREPTPWSDSPEPPQNPPKYSRTVSRENEKHNDRADMGPTPVCSQFASTSITVVPVMNGRTRSR